MSEHFVFISQVPGTQGAQRGPGHREEPGVWAHQPPLRRSEGVWGHALP